MIFFYLFWFCSGVVLSCFLLCSDILFQLFSLSFFLSVSLSLFLSFSLSLFVSVFFSYFSLSLSLRPSCILLLLLAPSVQSLLGCHSSCCLPQSRPLRTNTTIITFSCLPLTFFIRRDQLLPISSAQLLKSNFQNFFFFRLNRFFCSLVVTWLWTLRKRHLKPLSYLKEASA